MPLPDRWALKSQRLSWSQDDGWRLVSLYEGPNGPNGALRQAFESSLGDYTGIEYEFMAPLDNPEVPVRVTVTQSADRTGVPQSKINSDGQLSLTWTLLGSDEQLPLEAHENVATLEAAAPGWPETIRLTVEAWRRRVEEAVRNFDPAQGQLQIPEWRLPVPAGVTSQSLIDLADSYAALLRLEERPTFERARYVLRKIQTVTHWATVAVSHAQVNRWRVWSRLLTEEPTLAATNLLQVSGLSSLIWLKKAPEVTITAGGNRELTQEYWGGIMPPDDGSRKRLEFVFGAILT